MARTLAVGRTAAAPRAATQDMNFSLSLRAAGSVVDCGTDPIGSSNVTVMFWVKNFSLPATFGRAVINNGAFVIHIQTSVGASRNVILASNDNGVDLAYSTSNLAPLNTWTHVAVTRQGSTVRFFKNGAADTSSPLPAGAAQAGTTNLCIGNTAAGTRPSDGLLKNLTIVKRICTLSEIQAHMNGSFPADATRVFKCNEGSGSTLIDSSNNAVNGTITDGTFVSDTPTKKRQQVGGNLVYNGDFEFAPPFVAATSTAQRWIDGTAAGSTTNSLFGWALSYSTGTVGAAFDSSVYKNGAKSLRLSTLDAAGALVVGQSLASSVPTLYEAKNLLQSVLPNTSYTLTVWAKTNNAVANSVWADIREFSGGLAAGTTTNTAKLSGTTDWTQLSVTVTTGATTRYIGVLLRNTAAGNVSDAWFDDITLTKTTPDTRTVVS